MLGDPIADGYKRLKKATAIAAGLKGPRVGAELTQLCEMSLDFIRQNADLIPLGSGVPNKRYLMACLRDRAKGSRPSNAGLFDPSITRANIERVLEGLTDGMTEAELQRHLYTIAISYPVARDLMATDDKKSPATVFEMLIGHIVANKLNVNPTRSIAIPSLDMENTLPTDFIFDLGAGSAKIHMPVKISTRERVVQAWAHQRVLEGMHGAGRFLGVMVILTETNKQKETSVVEVCLPGQWAAYQMYISRMHRIYYFDLPEAYKPLRDRYPHIPVWPFSKFFSEYASLGQPGAD